MKKRGFITLECIISMFILSIIVYMITFSINNSFNLLNKNKEYSTMLNLAQNYMNETKNDIKYKNDKINTETIYLNKFQINKIITKKENYYNCYKLRLEVKSQDRSVNLESYVTKNNGSILIITVFVFLLVNIIAINCSALILSNTRYTRYDYEEVYMKEQCLGKIELIYSNILKEVDKTLTDTNDYDSFKEYIVSDNFLNTIKNIQDDDLNNTTYQINRTDLNDKNNIYYEIISKTTYNKFSKQIVAYVKIKNPFQEDSSSKNKDNSQDVEDSEERDLNKLKSSDKNIEVSQKEQEKINNIEDINCSDLVIMFGYKEE